MLAEAVRAIDVASPHVVASFGRRLWPDWGKGARSLIAAKIGKPSVGGIEIICANELSNLVKVRAGFRVKIVSGHQLSRKYATTSSPGMGFTLPVFRSS
jgi:hypothetical protein